MSQLSDLPHYVSFSIVDTSYLSAIPVCSLESFSGIGTTWSSVLHPSVCTESLSCISFCNLLEMTSVV